VGEAGPGMRTVAVPHPGRHLAPRPAHSARPGLERPRRSAGSYAPCLCLTAVSIVQRPTMSCWVIAYSPTGPQRWWESQLCKEDQMARNVTLPTLRVQPAVLATAWTISAIPGIVADLVDTAFPKV
jgi:hypothetical protein